MLLVVVAPAELDVEIDTIGLLDVVEVDVIPAMVDVLEVGNASNVVVGTPVLAALLVCTKLDEVVAAAVLEVAEVLVLAVLLVCARLEGVVPPVVLDVAGSIEVEVLGVVDEDGLALVLDVIPTREDVVSEELVLAELLGRIVDKEDDALAVLDAAVLEVELSVLAVDEAA